MSPAAILDYLTERGITLRASVAHLGEIDVDAPLSALTPAILDRIRARRVALLQYLVDVESSSSRQTRQSIHELRMVSAICDQIIANELGIRQAIDVEAVRVDRALEVSP